MNILISGATGFIGQHLVKSLLKNEEIKKIDIIVRNFKKAKNIFEDQNKINFIKLNLTNKNYKINTSYDVFIHLADIIPPAKDEDFLKNILMINSIGKNIIKENKTKKIIYTSTVDVYGIPLYLPIDENHPKHPITAYAISKYANELFLTFLCKKYNIALTILRFSQVYGPGEPTIKAIPLFIQKINKKQTILLENNGKIIRDWVYVEDVIEAIKKAIFSENTGVFNIATGKRNSLLKLISLLKKYTKKTAKIILLKERKDLRPKIILNINKAKKYLGYIPRFNLEKGIKNYLLKYEKTNF